MKLMYYSKYGFLLSELEGRIEESLENARKISLLDNDAFGRLGIFGSVAESLGYKTKHKKFLGNNYLDEINIPVKSKNKSFFIFPKHASIRFNTKVYGVSYGLERIIIPDGTDRGDIEKKINNLMDLYDKAVNEFLSKH